MNFPQAKHATALGDKKQIDTAVRSAKSAVRTGTRELDRESNALQRQEASIIAEMRQVAAKHGADDPRVKAALFLSLSLGLPLRPPTGDGEVTSPCARAADPPLKNEGAPRTLCAL